MKNYILAITISTIWQPTCIGMLSNSTKPTLEYLLSTASISNDICKNTFKDTTAPIQKDVITKYLLVKYVMKDNGLHFLSINTPLKPKKLTVDLQNMQSLLIETIESEIMHTEQPKKMVLFKRINDIPDTQPFIFLLPSLSTNDSDTHEQCGEYELELNRRKRNTDYESFQKKNIASNAVVDFNASNIWRRFFVDIMKSHSNLPKIIALDILISSKHVRHY